MTRFALITVLVAVGLVSASEGRPTQLRGLNPEGQPQGMREGETHRYFVWHDGQGWHLRTTTARERHRFHGEVIADEGAVRELRAFRLERNDWVQVSPDSRRIFFDLSTDEGIDGFDFRSDAQGLRFRLSMDGKDRPELVYVGLTGANPRNVPFTVTNPDARPLGGGAVVPLVPFGRPAGMGPGSTHRYLVWRDRNGLWHVRTTTARERHIFTGEIEAEGGRIFQVRAAETEKRDWVSLDSPNRVSFNLTTEGAIDGFDFRTNAGVLRFKLNIDGEARPHQVYVGERGVNPPSVPFTLPGK